ncbi:DUF3488 and transglutaminase-like domain-containing protein [Uruburuella testudinis]|uniref:DUF3488 and transglutaminase-like domain-containing protein n=1 Tax=Uruburuella testudinis TaxID=1282863 RepID=A0ABY4DYH8_9NEIS|nr:DUF3488 and transglutaminase-like domain-containing protein [Uruburuella testudinis]UOO81726.1 DUF3488 and transglutaminase-like domain-containing protein [Uruburuella testudinis]
MLILNPPFLRRLPVFRVQAAVLLVLLWTALPLAASLPVVVVALFGGLWLLRLALLRLRINKIPAAALLLMAVMAAALVWQQAGTLFGREGGVSLLLLLVMLKAFENGTRRDGQVLLLAMLFLTGAGVLLNQSLMAGVWLLSSLAAIGVCLALLAGLPLKQALRQSASAWLLALPLMAVLFAAVPRVDGPLWSMPQNQAAQAQTGLSDSMAPGSISNLVQSNEWVANITFSDGLQPQTGDLYWRAIVMSEFDGRRWQAVAHDDTDSAEAPASRRRLRYQMILRDRQGVIPVLDYPQTVPQGLQSRLGRVLRAEHSREGLRRITLESALTDTLPHRLSAAEHRRYTRLPDGNLQTRLLAESLMRQSAHVRQFIDNVLHYYRRQSFAYTLQPPRMGSSDSVDEFMFHARRGFCEHYAQSFVVMMRAAGLPARVVTGYHGGEYRPQGGFWQIRSKDAHAWAEVWLADEQAWLRVDPTAAASSRSEGSLARALPPGERSLLADRGGRWSHWYDTGQYYWQQWVVNYDQGKQNDLFAALGLGGFRPGTLLLVLPAGLLLAVLPLLCWWLAGRQRRDDLQAGFMLLKTALMGEGDPAVAATSADGLRRLLAQHGIEDAALQRLLDEYEYWLYAAEQPPSKRLQRRWYRRARALAGRYYRQRGR